MSEGIDARGLATMAPSMGPTGRSWFGRRMTAGLAVAALALASDRPTVETPPLPRPGDPPPMNRKARRRAARAAR